LKTRRNDASLVVVPLGFFFRPEASAPRMAKGAALCSRAKEGVPRVETKKLREKTVKKWIF